MSEIQYMEELNVPSHMRQVIMKWPYKLRERWRSTACDIQERRGFRATFTDLVDFLERQVKILCHPLFGDISDSSPSPAMQGAYKNRVRSKSDIKGSFATYITTTNSTTAPPPAASAQFTASRSPPTEACLVCEQPHSMLKCPELTRISHVEKIELLKANGVCFGCLNVGHISRECRVGSSVKNAV